MNYILVNLAIADMMVAVFMAPRHIFLSAFQHTGGDIGDYVCKFITGGNFMWVGGAASSFCLVAIAVERYYAIVYPHLEKGRITRKKLKGIVIACWAYAVMVDIPPFLVINFNEQRQFCTEYWPNISLARAYTVLMFCLDFAVPVLLMGMLYTKVVYNLWFRRNNQPTASAQVAVIKSRKKVTKMVLIVTAIYGFCWMPVLTLYMLSYHLPSQFEYASIIHNTAVVFICINSSINPFIYSFQMRGFKAAIKRLFSFGRSRLEDIRNRGQFGTSTTKILEARVPTRTVNDQPRNDGHSVILPSSVIYAERQPASHQLIHAKEAVEEFKESRENVVLALVFYSPNVEDSDDDSDFSKESESQEDAAPSPINWRQSMRSFWNPLYAIGIIGIGLQSLGIYAPLSHMVKHANEIGYPAQKSSMLLIYIGVASLIGKVVAGTFFVTLLKSRVLGESSRWLSHYYCHYGTDVCYRR
ncbi:hypothetical protein QZH41_004954 [Actinostola sp. cb2023]|nr:hypothetical protein QZH41_004954 [Actinostola sp. cb2023]